MKRKYGFSAEIFFENRFKIPEKLHFAIVQHKNTESLNEYNQSSN